MKNGEKLVNQKIEFKDEDFKIIVHESSSRFVEKAFHEEIELKYYYDDNSAMTVGSEIILAERGDVTVANPYEVHSNLNLSGKEGKYCLVIIDLDFLAGMNREIDLRHLLIEQTRRFCHHIKNDNRLGTIICRLYEEMREEREHYKTVVKSLVSELAVLLLRSYISDDAPQTGAALGDRRARLIAPALSVIHSDFSKKLTVEMLADACSVSKFHFCRVFKEAMGVTAVQYLNKYRIDVAEIMLKSGTDGISEVAWKCGFDDESYFYRCYKKLKGVPPGKACAGRKN